MLGVQSLCPPHSPADRAPSMGSPAQVSRPHHPCCSPSQTVLLRGQAALSGNDDEGQMWPWGQRVPRSPLLPLGLLEGPEEVEMV